MAEQSSIQCPNCGTIINVNDILKHQLEDSIRKEFQLKATAQAKELELKNEQFEKEKAEFKANKERENETFINRLNEAKKKAENEITEKLKIQLDEENKDRFLLMEKELSEKSEKLRELNKMTAEIAKLQRDNLEQRDTIETELQKKFTEILALERDKIRKQEEENTEKLKIKLNEENKDRLLLMEKELSEKSEKLRELNKMTGEIAKLQREKLELKEAIEAESQKKLTEILALERDKIRKQEEEKNELKIKEYQKQSDDQKKLIEEMKRKQEQGSMQLQGEVMELAIEEWLASNFPLDTIDEVKKGINGADCLQIVNTRELQNCGSIYYESKRTKAFQSTWIEKFKNDIRDKKANIGVLVTEAMPAGMERMGMRDGIWICTYEEFKGLSAVLRQSLIHLNQAVQAQENKGDKKEMLYDFLMSNEFRLQIEGIAEGFKQMQDDLNREKISIQRSWKQREKQIEKVIINTVGMYGSIRGIGGNSVQKVKALELGFDDQTEELE